jgi:hypothetical protein
MGFSTAYLKDNAKVAGGELQGTSHVIYGTTAFDNGLKVGRFAKITGSQVGNMNASATPVIAGVVLREVSGVLGSQSAATIDSSIITNVSLCNHGLVTVDVKAGQTPTPFAPVFASNVGDASDGLATLTADAGAKVAINAKYIQQVDAGVWLIQMMG